MKQQPLYVNFDTRNKDGDFDEIAIPVYILDNLADHIQLRPYQIQALKRYLYYCDSYKRRAQSNLNLLFNMATGSGKTVIMAALILDMYARGYRKFVFFVRRDNIVKKTIENFANSASSKYLFAENLSIDGETPAIQVVDDLNSANDKDIQILFLTTSKLHGDITTPREDRISLDELAEEKIVFLADEAHNINAWTGGARLSAKDEIEKSTWEQSVERIFRQNPDNVKFEFTATIDLKNADIARKYNDVLLYKYDLKEFKNDRYSKDIQLYLVADDIRARMLQAILISQYRLKIAEKHGLLLKPVVLFKSNTIAESLDSHMLFTEMIRSLDADKITAALGNNVETHLGENILKKLHDYLHEKRVSMQSFCDELKVAFSEERVVNVNDEKEAEQWQIDINRLEDEDNHFRVIFAVDKLNEGWDVLNLYDIVRLNIRRDGDYLGGGEYKPGKGTMQEAQLIGRGARLWPFAVRDDQEVDKRKYDEFRDDELRILEELYYHSYRDTDYLKEIRTALDKTGIMDVRDPKVQQLRFKDSFKNQPLYKTGVVYANRQIDNPHSNKKSPLDYLDNVTLRVKLPTHTVETIEAFDEEASVEDSGGTTKTITFSDVPRHIIEKSLDKQYKFYSFANLKNYSPKLSTKDEFIKKLGELKIIVNGAREELYDPSPDAWLYIADESLKQIQAAMSTKESPRIGSSEFTPRAFNTVFREKKVTYERAQGTNGIGMREAEAELALDLQTREWYAYEEDYGDRYEKLLVKLIDKNIDKLRERWDKLYLVRNEKDLKLYDFESDGVFMPDYLLFLQKNGEQPKTYYVFMEPKGEQLEASDEWKERFLESLEQKAEVLDELGLKKTGIKIVGLKFYQPARESEFEQEFLLRAI